MARRVVLGVETLARAQTLLRGRRVGLITGPTGVDGRLRATVDILAEIYDLRALFACEHGIRGAVQAGGHVESEVDAETGVPVFSLYGASRRMTQQMLDAFDVLVYDIQDVGARFYTYLYTLSYAMQDCARAGKTVVVLDRPNPLGGAMEGTLLDEAFHSFVGEYAMPTRYGLTVGEYARFVRAHLQLDLDLFVCPMEGYARNMLYSDTGLVFVPPSPNIPTLESALSYIGTCVFEGTNLSEGRGTATPFQWIGAPWLDTKELAAAMRALQLPGVLFRRAAFVPTFSKFAGQNVNALMLHVTDARVYQPFATGLYLLDQARRQAGFAWLPPAEDGGWHIDHLLGTDAFRRGMSARELIAAHAPRVKAFCEQAREWFLYE